MALTAEDVINKRFQPTKFREGYDQDEVDDFLDEVVVELRRLHQENDTLRAGHRAVRPALVCTLQRVWRPATPPTKEALAIALGHLHEHAPHASRQKKRRGEQPGGKAKPRTDEVVLNQQISLAPLGELRGAQRREPRRGDVLGLILPRHEEELVAPLQQ